MMDKARFMSELKKRLNKTEWNLVMEILMTPTSQLIEEARQEWRKQDFIHLNQAKKELEFFDGLSAKYIFNEEKRTQVEAIINDLEKEIKDLNAKLKPKDNTHKQTLCWHVG